jgi:hypothetical protein
MTLRSWFEETGSRTARISTRQPTADLILKRYFHGPILDIKALRD